MMEKLKKLAGKLLNRETISYLIFGVLTTAVDYVAAYLLFYKAGLGEVASNTIAWVLAVAFAYITNKLFVFESKARKLKELLTEIFYFAGARLVTLVLTNLFLMFTARIGIEFMLAKIIISVAVIVLNYFFSKIIIFKKPKEGVSKEERNG